MIKSLASVSHEVIFVLESRVHYFVSVLGYVNSVDPCDQICVCCLILGSACFWRCACLCALVWCFHRPVNTSRVYVKISCPDNLFVCSCSFLSRSCEVLCELFLPCLLWYLVSV